jgi:hypothetical protein
LSRIASGLAGLECKALDEIAKGLNNIVRPLEFPDKNRWAARVHIRRGKPPLVNSTKLETEIATMQSIKEYSDLPVPQVFAYEVDEENTVGAAYIFMELLPGTVAVDALGGSKTHLGTIPKEHRQSFFEAWANSVKFKLDEEAITNMMRGAPIPAEKTIACIDNFPVQIKAMASRLSLHDKGPFLWTMMIFFTAISWYMRIALMSLESLTGKEHVQFLGS